MLSTDNKLGAILQQNTRLTQANHKLGNQQIKVFRDYCSGLHSQLIQWDWMCPYFTEDTLIFNGLKVFKVLIFNAEDTI